MPTDAEQLKFTLDQLNRQLSEIGQLDPDQRQQLDAALTEIQLALKTRTAVAAKSAASESLMRRLGEAARHFEESHPTLAGTIGGLIDTLGRSGI
ncbi:MAG TPA: DUF4404 family protein [Pirellulales bacterium]|jgi:hypothetical protein